MTYRLVYGTVIDRPRKVIHVVRVQGEYVAIHEIDDIAERMRQRVLSRSGEQLANIVVIQGNSKETLRLFGDAYAIGRARTALFNAALKFAPIELE